MIVSWGWEKKGDRLIQSIIWLDAGYCQTLAFALGGSILGAYYIIKNN